MRRRHSCAGHVAKISGIAYCARCRSGVVFVTFPTPLSAAYWNRRYSFQRVRSDLWSMFGSLLAMVVSTHSRSFRSSSLNHACSGKSLGAPDWSATPHFAMRTDTLPSPLLRVRCLDAEVSFVEMEGVTVWELVIPEMAQGSQYRLLMSSSPLGDAAHRCAGAPLKLVLAGALHMVTPVARSNQTSRHNAPELLEHMLRINFCHLCRCFSRQLLLLINRRKLKAKTREDRQQHRSRVSSFLFPRLPSPGRRGATREAAAKNIAGGTRHRQAGLRRNTRHHITDDCMAASTLLRLALNLSNRVKDRSPTEPENFSALPLHVASTEASPLMWSAAILRAVFLQPRRFAQRGRSSCLQKLPAL